MLTSQKKAASTKKVNAATSSHDTAKTHSSTSVLNEASPQISDEEVKRFLHRKLQNEKKEFFDDVKGIDFGDFKFLDIPTTKFKELFEEVFIEKDQYGMPNYFKSYLDISFLVSIQFSEYLDKVWATQDFRHSAVKKAFSPLYTFLWFLRDVIDEGILRNGNEEKFQHEFRMQFGISIKEYALDVNESLAMAVVWASKDDGEQDMLDYMLSLNRKLFRFAIVCFNYLTKK